MKYRIRFRYIIIAGLMLTGMALIERNYYIQGSRLAVLGAMLIGLSIIIFAVMLAFTFMDWKSDGKKYGTLIYLLIFALIIGFLALTNIFYAKFRANQLVHQGAELTAKITDLIYETRGRRDGHFLYYEYQVGTNIYQFNHIVDAEDFENVDTLTVRYLPQRPEIHEVVGMINDKGTLKKKNAHIP